MLNKRGFTMVELMAVIAIIGILSGVAIMAVTKYQKKTQDDVYKNFLKQLKDSSTNYLVNNTSKIPEKNKEISITSNELIDNSYLDQMVDPVNKSEKCTATVKVKNLSDISGNGSYDPSSGFDENGNIISSNIKNLDLKYTVCLVCSQYNSCKEF